MRILITGCGGFVGRNLAQTLAAGGHDVVALVYRTWPAAIERQPRLRVERVDLAGAGALPPGGCDAVIHCAATIPSRTPDGAELLRVNVESARRIFAHAALAGADHVIFCSSMAVYGEIDADVVSPETPSRGPGAYGRSKLECERLLGDLCRTNPRIGGLSIRLPGVVGAGSHDNFLSDTMACLLAGQPVLARNPDALFNNVVHIGDLADFLSEALPALPRGHRVVTMAADEPQPIRRVVGILEAAARRTGAVCYEDGGKPFLISNDAARALGYRPSTVVDSIVRFARDVIAFASSSVS